MSPFLRRVAVPVATVWASPADGPQERETQLLHGERVLVVAQHDGWSAVRATGQPCSTDPRGYPGWVRTDQLSETPPTPGLECVVARPSCLCSTSREGGLELSFGTRLQVLDGDGPVATVALSGGGQGAVPRAALRRLLDGPPTAADVLASARLLLDVPYVWGGTSAWGLDCSGLVHLVLRSWGVEVPRDAHDQAADLAAVPLDAVEPGDLYFFARAGAAISHVGLVTRPVAADGTRWMLHAPEAGRGVEEGPLVPDRRATLVAAARLPLS